MLSLAVQELLLRHPEGVAMVLDTLAVSVGLSWFSVVAVRGTSLTSVTLESVGRSQRCCAPEFRWML